MTREELDRLEAEGISLDTADLIDYANTSAEHSAMLAYLAGIVAFLDEVTDGPDIDLRAVLGERRLRLRIEDMQGAPDGRRSRTRMAGTRSTSGHVRASYCASRATSAAAK